MNIHIPNKDRIPWKRVMRAIYQLNSDTIDISTHDLKKVQDVLRELSELLGERSLSRQMMTSIGSILVRLNGAPVNILAPVCFSSSLMRGKESSTSELVLKHITFIEKIKSAINIGKTFFLFPVHCSYQTEFDKDFAKKLLNVTQRSVQEGYLCKCMHSVIEDIAHLEKEEYELIQGNQELLELSKKIAQRRSIYYSRLRIPEGERDAKTSVTMAEYRALGKYALKNNMLICSHTTDNIASYQSVSAPVLHNEVGFM